MAAIGYKYRKSLSPSLTSSSHQQLDSTLALFLFVLVALFVSILLFPFANGEDASFNDIVLGNHPLEVSVNPITNMIYVSNYESKSVSVIDGATNSVLVTVPVGVFPSAIGVNPDTNKVYVIHRGPNGSVVSVIDGVTNKVISAIEIGFDAIDLAVDPTTNMIYVSYWNHSTKGAVLIIDGGLDKVVHTIPLEDVHGALIDVNLVTNTLYASDGKSIYVIDVKTRNVANAINLGSYHPVDLTVSVGTNKLYVLAWYSPTSDTVGVARITGSLIIMEGSTNRIVTNITLGFDPGGIAVNPITKDVYVSYEDIQNRNFVISAIDGMKDTITGTIELSYKPGKLAFNPNNDSLYMINETSNSLTIIDSVTAIPEFSVFSLIIFAVAISCIFATRLIPKVRF